MGSQALLTALWAGEGVGLGGRDAILPVRWGEAFLGEAALDCGLDAQEASAWLHRGGRKGEGYSSGKNCMSKGPGAKAPGQECGCPGHWGVGEAAAEALGLLVNARPQHWPGVGRSFSQWPCLSCEP